MAKGGAFAEAILRSLVGAYVKARVEAGPLPVSEESIRAEAIDYAASRANRLFEEIDEERNTAFDDLREQRESKSWSDEKYVAELQRKGFSEGVARTRARTEAAIVYNVSEGESWGEQGTELVRITDGTKDAVCAYANGSIWTLEDFTDNPIAHPNCVRNGTPVPDSEVSRLRRFVKRPHPKELADPKTWFERE